MKVGELGRVRPAILSIVSYTIGFRYETMLHFSSVRGTMVRVNMLNCDRSVNLARRLVDTR